MSSLLSSPEIALAEVDYHAFNRAVWAELCSSPELVDLDFRIETDRFGQLIMSPPPAPGHGNRQNEIGFLLRSQMESGKVITECPVSTSEGVKAADVAWCSDSAWESLEEDSCFLQAPEICVEVLSPSNTKGEIAEKKRLYFAEGAKEVWLCDLEGKITFFEDAEKVIPKSQLFPRFPDSV